MKAPATVRSITSPGDLSAEEERSRKVSIEELVRRASRGDRNAATAVYLAYKWVLLGEARRALGPWEDDAEEVVQEFLLLLLGGRWPYVPHFGKPGQWLRRTVCTLAEGWRDDRERDWGRSP
jgi:DNA-directed RNA polymerase specialized sigma24 family protein